MIQKLYVENAEVAQKILAVQLPSYEVEAGLIGFYDLPPLKDTIHTLQNCEETFFGYILDGELAGAISYRRKENMLDIHRMIVHPNHFRKGIARSLLVYVQSIEPYVEKVMVATGAKNIPAKSLYLRDGFEEVGNKEVAPDVYITLFEKSIKM